VAEDNEVNQFVARKLLASHGYDCDIVANGRLAVSAVSHRHYDLVLMDCAMPEMDGFEATRQIRAAEAAAPNSRHLPIVALTAEAIRGDREKCREAGMDEYVSKPINPKDLFAKIRLLTTVAPKPATPPASILPAESLPAVNLSNPSNTPAETNPAPKAPEVIPIDVAALLARSMGDAGFATETLQRFKIQARKDLALLQQSVESHIAPEAARLAHGLKGIAGHIGATSLRATAARIESLGNSADLDQIEQTLAELKTEIDRCIECIPAAVERLETAAAA
jgi:CheY-like chemotaxis protein